MAIAAVRAASRARQLLAQFPKSRRGRSAREVTPEGVEAGSGSSSAAGHVSAPLVELLLDDAGRRPLNTAVQFPFRAACPSKFPSRRAARAPRPVRSEAQEVVRWLILPVAAGDGEGDHAEHGGGATLTPQSPSTVLRTVPLPMRSAHREDFTRTRFCASASPAPSSRPPRLVGRMPDLDPPMAVVLHVDGGPDCPSAIYSRNRPPASASETQPSRRHRRPFHPRRILRAGPCRGPERGG
jgi:hypothetical protein